MGLWSTIKSGLCFIGRGIKHIFSTVAAKVGGFITTAAAAVATFAANPVVKTVATVVSIAVPAITVGVGVAKAFKEKKEKEPDTLIEKMMLTDDEEEIYHDEGVDEMRQQIVDKKVYGKKEAKKMAKQRAKEKTFTIKNKKSSSRTKDIRKAMEDMDKIEFVMDDPNDMSCLEAVCTMDVDDEEEQYIDEPKKKPATGQIFRDSSKLVNNLDTLVGC